eukprot:scaffold98140_cov20-Tisochrysis_lutea.AAC.1
MKMSLLARKRGSRDIGTSGRQDCTETARMKMRMEVMKLKGSHLLQARPPRGRWEGWPWPWSAHSER